MTVFSKYIVTPRVCLGLARLSRLQGQLGIQQGLSRHVQSRYLVQIAAWRCLLGRTGSRLRPWEVQQLTLRQFRWDAKPDNQFGQSFKQGFSKPFHPFVLLLLCALLAPLFNWENILPEEIPFLPKFVKVFFGVLTGHQPSKSPDEDFKPSGLLATVYDKYGAEGVDAVRKSWEITKDQEGSSAQKQMHALMMAQAAARYKEQVEKEAKELGLEDDEEVKKLLKASTDSTPSVEGNKSPFAMFNLKAEELIQAEENLGMEEEIGKQEKTGFRDRKIIEYENRMRQYSTPDKVFRYFASYKLTDEKGNSEVMMTPEDFLRSICPGEKQPDNLGLDQFIQVGLEEVADISILRNHNSSSVFYQLGAGGLISFSDYIFLLTVLSTSRRHFQIAFKMFDLNGDGTVDAEEFEKVTTLLRSTSSTGARHRDHGTTGNTFKGINSGLICYFFGEKKDGTLTVDRFLDFQRCLQEEILALEFKRKDETDKGRISERDFSDLLIAYAGFSSKKKTKMLRRVRRAYDEETSPGITLKDYLNFYQVLYCINDIDTALTFHTIAGAPIETSTMKHVARTVAHVDLSDHLLGVVFTLFDDNGDGMLSNKEFVSVMKQRAKRGLEKPKEIGISRIFSSIFKCAGDCRPAIIGGAKKTE